MCAIPRIFIRFGVMWTAEKSASDTIAQIRMKVFMMFNERFPFNIEVARGWGGTPLKSSTIDNFLRLNATIGKMKRMEVRSTPLFLLSSTPPPIIILPATSFTMKIGSIAGDQLAWQKHHLLLLICLWHQGKVNGKSTDRFESVTQIPQNVRRWIGQRVQPRFLCYC